MAVRIALDYISDHELESRVKSVAAGDVNRRAVVLTEEEYIGLGGPVVVEMAAVEVQPEPAVEVYANGLDDEIA